MLRPACLIACLTVLLAMVLATPAAALDDAHWQKANGLIDRGIAYLRTTQNADGSWSPDAGPAITAMVMQGMLDHGVSPDDPAVQKALAYILSRQKTNGGIHDGLLENYNTAICLSALARLNDRPEVAPVISKAQDYLRELQWVGQRDEEGNPVDEDHPFYGGAGYGKHGRPDLSNTQIMLQALHDSGIDCNDPAFQRAMVFISRCQGIESNTAFKDQIEQDGGFIYATSINKDHIGVPQSMASPEMIDEALAGRPVSGLRTYGSMTYAGFKSYLYAELDREDPRVVAAYDWIRANYSLDHNPGLRDNPNTEMREDKQGLYYYYMTFARALKAWGEPTIEKTDGTTIDWGNDLVDTLAAAQREDGSWINEADRWSEGDANLVTAYALIALTETLR